MSVNSSTLNIIRVIAMAGIVADHGFQASGIPIVVNTGLHWGGLFLMVFFALSAYLFGMKWANRGYNRFEVKSFLQKRFLRIYLPLWLMLPVAISIEYLILHSFDVKTIVFNIVGLGWAKPFGTGGHLWYITLMMFLYMVYLAFSRIRLDKCKMRYWFIGYATLAALYVFGEKYFTTFSAVAPVIIVLFASLLFFKRDEVMALSHRWPKSQLFVTMIALVLSWWMYAQGWNDTHKAIATFSSFSAGLCLFVCLITFIKSPQSNRFVSHLADISYEVYLVHLPLLPFTSFLLKHAGMDCKLFELVIWLMLTYFTALGVHIVTQRLMVHINYKHE